MEWFLSLAAYGDLGGEPDPEDEDVKLLPNIIEKVLIPKITGQFLLMPPTASVYSFSSPKLSRMKMM